MEAEPASIGGHGGRAGVDGADGALAEVLGAAELGLELRGGVGACAGGLGGGGEHGGLAFALGGDEGLGGGLEGVHHRLVALAGAGDGADFLEAALEEVGQLVGVERGGALGGGVGHAFEPGAVERGGGAGGLFLELLGHVGQEGGEVVALGVVDGVDGGDDGGAVVAVAAGGGVQLGEVLFVGLDGGLGLLPHGLELFERHGCSFFCGRGAVAAGLAAATARP